MNESPLRVAIYARISRDLVGLRLGVDDQLARGRAYAELRNCIVVAEEHDNDISAFRGKDRPGYNRVLTLARTGQIDAVVVYQLSRLTRNRRERAEFIEDFGALGVNLHETQGAVYDLSTATGRAFADMRGVMDTQESDIKTERVKAAVERRVKAGRHVSHPGYGWRSTGETSALRGYEPHPDQAPIIAELARDVAAGKSLNSLAQDLNRRGVPVPGAYTPNGKLAKRRRKTPAGTWETYVPTPDELPTWSGMTIKQVLTRASNIGLVVLKSGETLPATWPPLLSEELYRAVQRRVDAGKGKGASAPRPGGRKRLLSGGVAWCGVCGSELQFINKKRTRADGSTYVRETYRCAGPGSCVHRRADHLDVFARDVLLARMSRPDTLAWLMGDESEAVAASEELTALHKRKDDAADAYAEGAITLAQLVTINDKIDPQIEAATARRDAAARSLDLGLLGELAGPTALQVWNGWTVAQRRLALDTVGLRIDVDPTGPAGTPRTELDQATVRVSFSPWRS